jgi:hypothetical protein
MCTQRWEANDRLYSVLGYYSRLVKSEKRHLLGEDRLEALSRISVEGLHPYIEYNMTHKTELFSVTLEEWEK